MTHVVSYLTGRNRWATTDRIYRLGMLNPVRLSQSVYHLPSPDTNAYYKPITLFGGPQSMNRCTMDFWGGNSQVTMASNMFQHYLIIWMIWGGTSPDGLETIYDVLMMMVTPDCKSNTFFAEDVLAILGHSSWRRRINCRCLLERLQFGLSNI